MMKNPIFDLENWGQLIHDFDLYMSKYGIRNSRVYSKASINNLQNNCLLVHNCGLKVA